MLSSILHTVPKFASGSQYVADYLRGAAAARAPAHFSTSQSKAHKRHARLLMGAASSNASEVPDSTPQTSQPEYAVSSDYMKKLLWPEQPAIGWSVMTAYNGFQEGHDISYLATNRSRPIKEDTVVSYLADSGAAGLPINWTNLFEAANLTPTLTLKVVSAILAVRGQLSSAPDGGQEDRNNLKDLKMAAGPEVTYGQVRVVCAAILHSVLDVESGELGAAGGQGQGVGVWGPLAVLPGQQAATAKGSSTSSTGSPPGWGHMAHSRAAQALGSSQAGGRVWTPPPQPPDPELQKRAEEREEQRADWHAARARGIGGSDVAAIMGLSKWADAYDIWLSKTGRKAPTPENTYQRRGRLLEDAIAGWYAEETGSEVTQGEKMPVEGPEPWMLGSPDFYVTDPDQPSGRFGLEIKTARSMEMGGWGPGGSAEVPDYYRTQVAWYMACTGLERWDVAVFFLHNDHFERYTLHRDPVFEAQMVERCRKFWVENVEADVAPACSRASSLSHKYPVEAVSEELLEAGPEDRAHILELAALKAQIKALRLREQHLETTLKERIGHRQGFAGDWGTVTWKTYKGRVRLDSELLAVHHPEIYEKYSVAGDPYRMFRVNVKDTRAPSTFQAHPTPSSGAGHTSHSAAAHTGQSDHHSDDNSSFDQPVPLAESAASHNETNSSKPFFNAGDPPF